MNLNGKTVFISGASSGIGEAIARSFADAGARLVLCARSLDKLEQLAQSILKKKQTEILTFQLDVSDRQAVEKSISSLPNEWSQIDILVNNAGGASGLDKLHEGDIDDWEIMIDANVKGLLYLSRLIVPQMVQRNNGMVINIGSIAGRAAYANGAVYCATKAAVKLISDGLRIDTVDKNIRVANIEPGLVETNFSTVRFHGDSERAKTVYQGLDALTAEDIADTALFIATRPLHVQICEVLITPNSQAAATVVHRK
ncbi:MAG: SDR family NAD(P)-dependent oxidoreductase [Calditrichaeota bacterium]|nr:SDR family NAD(P)-dependent oxidoreductase [Calditrichota bacterium]